jgi:TRAP-type C4-dicarboxylate transport system substrate-binding protein
MTRKGLFAAVLTVATTTSLAAQTVTLKLNSPAPPRSYLHAGVFEPWAKAVEADSEGTLKIQLFYGGTLGNFGVSYDRVVDGVADIGFILSAITGGKFKQQDVAALPFETRDSNESAQAMWNIYQKGVTAGEFGPVRPLGIWTFPNSAIHAKEPIRSMDDLKGKKIIASNLIAAKIASALGATPVTLRPDEVYQAISRGTADASLMPFTGMITFKVHEVAKYHLNAALGSDAAMLIINKKSYDGLPAKAKAAIDKHSNLALSKKLGAATQGEWERALNIVKDSTATLTPDQERQWKAALAPIAEEWARTAPDGAKVLAAFRAEVAATRAQK